MKSLRIIYSNILLTKKQEIGFKGNRYIRGRTYAEEIESRDDGANLAAQVRRHLHEANDRGEASMDSLQET